MLLYCLFLVSCSFSKTKFASVFLQERKYRGTEGSDLFFVLGGTRSLLAESWLLLLMSCLGAAYWMFETKASLFEFSEVFQFEKVC